MLPFIIIYPQSLNLSRKKAFHHKDTKTQRLQVKSLRKRLAHRFTQAKKIITEWADRLGVPILFSPQMNADEHRFFDYKEHREFKGLKGWGVRGFRVWVRGSSGLAFQNEGVCQQKESHIPHELSA